MKLWTRLPLTTRDQQTCIMGPTNALGQCQKDENPHPARPWTSNTGQQHKYWTAVAVINKFPYLGSIILNNVTCERDLDKSMKVAHTVYRTLSHKVSSNHRLSIRTKIMVFWTVVHSTLLYDWETWTLNCWDIKRSSEESSSSVEWTTTNKVFSCMSIQHQGYI